MIEDGGNKKLKSNIEQTVFVPYKGSGEANTDDDGNELGECRMSLFTLTKNAKDLIKAINITD